MPIVDARVDALFRGPGAARALARAIDWSATPLGATCDWPQSLRTAADLCFASHFPTVLLWGRELILLHNDAHIPILGDRYPAAMGRPARDALPDTWSVFGPIVERALADAELPDDRAATTADWAGPTNVALTFDRGDSPRPGHLTVSFATVRDESARPAGVLITAVDMGARVIAETALRESEARFRALAETSPLGVGVSSLDGKIIYTNRAYEQILGADAGALIGRPSASEYYDAADREVWLAAMQRDGIVIDFEVRFRRENGTPVWVSMNLAPIEYGGRQAIIGVVQDITLRKRAEAAAERERVHRERNVVRRQLAAVEEAERARLARELHDQLGQELTAFRLGIDDATRLVTGHANVDHALLSRLAQLQQLAARMTANARAIALELRPPELDEVGLESALAIYVREWSERYGIRAEIALSGLHEQAVPMEAASAIYRIAQEALTNVAKHASATQVSVIVDHNHGELRLIVEDDGRGFNVDETMMRARVDRRLGLAGIHERASLVGGWVAIESSDGRGTAIYVRMPMVTLPPHRTTAR